MSLCISSSNAIRLLIIFWRSRYRLLWVSYVDCTALNIERLNSPASIISFVMEETILYLPLDLIMVGSVDGYGGALMGSGVGSEMSLITCGDA